MSNQQRTAALNAFKDMALSIKEFDPDLSEVLLEKTDDKLLEVMSKAQGLHNKAQQLKYLKELAEEIKTVLTDNP